MPIWVLRFIEVFKIYYTVENILQYKIFYESLQLSLKSKFSKAYDLHKTCLSVKTSHVTMWRIYVIIFFCLMNCCLYRVFAADIFCNISRDNLYCYLLNHESYSEFWQSLTRNTSLQRTYPNKAESLLVYGQRFLNVK